MCLHHYMSDQLLALKGRRILKPFCLMRTIAVEFAPTKEFRNTLHVNTIIRVLVYFLVVYCINMGTGISPCRVLY